MPRFLAHIRETFRMSQKAYRTVQVSHRSNYSIERAYKLNQFCRETSVLRALCIILLVPLPALAYSTLVELLPLDSPMDGWRHNSILWIRYFSIMILVGSSFTYQLSPFLINLSISKKNGAILAFAPTMLTFSISILVADRWMFPVPFMIVIGSIPYIICYIFIFISIFGWRRLMSSQQQLSILRGQALLLFLHSTIIFVYVAYNAAFQIMTPTQQTLFICVLPVIKVVMKNAYAWAFKSNQDSIPEAATFTVEVFNALFVSLCMQTAGSIYTALAIIAIDICQAALSIISLSNDSKTLHELIRNSYSDESSDVKLLSIIVAMLDTSGRKTQLVQHDRKNLPQSKAGGLIVPLKDSIVPHEFIVQKSFVREKESKSLFKGFCKSRTAPLATTKKVRTATKPPSSKENEISSNAEALKADTHEDSVILEETLKLLYRSEFIVLTEYVEIILPIVYISYTSILFHLPNAVYYPHTRTLDETRLQETVINILTYASMEAASFVALHFLLKRRFGFSPMYLLAFVLESEKKQIIGRLTMFISYMFQFTLLHYGVDFTFKFDWNKMMETTTDTSP